MNDMLTAKLGMKDHMLVFTALEKTYGRDCAIDIAARSVEPLLKLVAIARAASRLPNVQFLFLLC
jgi:hypothetical protein